MNFDVSARTILYVRHGSHAYGLNVVTSDEDFKGVCVKPKACYLGFLNNFEQAEHMGSKNDGVDSVTYSLDKFARLAIDCNPNIIEVLHVADKDVLKVDDFGEELRAARNDFLSKKARFTFAGYAHAQLKRIKTHRTWLLDPPKAPPERKDFGLSDSDKISKSELGAGQALFESPVAMLAGGVPANVVRLFTQEKAYQAAKTHFDQYVNWKKTRNPARAELEEKFGYDVKHACHLIRLMRMCHEILSSGKVLVERPDREELLMIRRGKRTYDGLIEEADRLEAECDALYVTSSLPREPDRSKLDALIVDMTDRYLRVHG